MNDWFEKRIANASWLRFIVPLAALLAYAAWMSRDGGELMTALEAAGGNLPEMTPGFPSGLAAQAYSSLGDKVTQYSFFQVIDIPYAILNMVVLTAIIALALKRFQLGASPLRFALVLPPLYLLAEFLENPLLIILANGEPGAPAGLVIFQQLATNFKWITLTPALIFGLASLAALIIISIFRLVKR